MQRTAIARALVARPRLLLADEPTGNLDSATGADILDVLCDQVSEEGTALLMVTHDLDAAARAKHILHLRDGRLANT
jgi:putative ABC transport system ATP-binding protein